MNRYLFLIAWFEGSDSLEAENDLLPRFEAGETEMFSVLVMAPSLHVATAYGCERAFHENFTGFNTVSDCFKLAEDHFLSREPSFSITADLSD